MHNTMKYKTYIGSVEFDEEKEMFLAAFWGYGPQSTIRGRTQARW